MYISIHVYIQQRVCVCVRARAHVPLSDSLHFSNKRVWNKYLLLFKTLTEEHSFFLQERVRRVFRAVSTGVLREVENALERRNLALAKDVYGRSPLHMAILAGHNEIAQHIIQNFPLSLKTRDNVSVPSDGLYGLYSHIYITLHNEHICNMLAVDVLMHILKHLAAVKRLGYAFRKENVCYHHHYSIPFEDHNYEHVWIYISMYVLQLLQCHPMTILTIWSWKDKHKKEHILTL